MIAEVDLPYFPLKLKYFIDNMSSPGGRSNYSAGDLGTPLTPSRPRRNYDAWTLIPVTIKMITDAISAPGGGGEAGDMYLKDGRPLNMVKMVGAVTSCEKTVNHTMLDVEDGTGRYSVKVLNIMTEPSGIQEMKEKAFQVGQYIRVIGKLDEFDSNRMIFADDVRVIGTGDEITYHFCEVAYSFKKHLKKKSEGAMLFGTELMGIGIGNLASSKPSADGTNLVSHIDNERSNNVNEAVMTLLCNEGANKICGVHINTIKRSLSGQGYDESDIMKAITDLSNGGRIFSTIDDNHYQRAE